MSRALRLPLRCLLAISAAACAGGETAPGNDTRPPESSPAAPPPAAPRIAWTWDRRAGSVFALPGGSAGTARVVRPEWTDDQALDSLSPGGWMAEGPGLELVAGSAVVGTARLTDLQVDSGCVGWPVGRIDPVPSGPWRVAFQPGLVTGLSFDSLPVLPRVDSSRVTTDAARAASLFVNDTTASFRGRPFIVRQASRFDADEGTAAMFVEIVRLVPQEANPQQEQLVMIVESSHDRPAPRVAFAQRTAGLEESIASVELLAIVRVKGSGRTVAILQRERENGFFLQWVERVSPGRWVVTWQSALDAC